LKYFQEKDSPMVAQPILLKNGTSISVQASAMHYCTPRINDLEYKHTHFEVWHIFQKDNMTSAEGAVEFFGKDEFELNDCQPWENVPYKKIEKWVELNGGIDFARAIIDFKENT
ncbi:MAG: hypothetical protein RLZZ292_4068, partial [Bacteroidota bacterium]